MNQKNERIRKLYERGITSKGEIARRIGYGGAMGRGIKRVEEAFAKLGLDKENGKMEASSDGGRNSLS